MPRQWFSTNEIAAMGLPGMPCTRQGVVQKAARDGWDVPSRENAWWRLRKGRGGGIEFRLTVVQAEAAGKPDAALVDEAVEAADALRALSTALRRLDVQIKLAEALLISARRARRKLARRLKKVGGNA